MTRQPRQVSHLYRGSDTCCVIVELLPPPSSEAHLSFRGADRWIFLRFNRASYFSQFPLYAKLRQLLAVASQIESNQILRYLKNTFKILSLLLYLTLDNGPAYKICDFLMY